MRILFPVLYIVIIHLLLLGFLDGSKYGQISGEFAAQDTTVSIFHRRLLHSGTRAVGQCSKNDITVSQGSTGREPNGIPIYSVTITNTCVSGCTISDIHLHCGEFSSANLVDPNKFKRIAIDDCLVKNGQAFPAGETISFTYTTNSMFPLSVSSATVSCG